MTGSELAELAKAAGLPGVMIAAFIWLASRVDLSKNQGASREDVMEKLDRITDKIEQGRKENEHEFRGLRDRLTTVETISKEQARRLERLEK